MRSTVNYVCIAIKILCIATMHTHIHTCDMSSYNIYSIVPDSPPQDIVVISINPTSLMVSWQPPPMSSQNVSITGYLILYTLVGSNALMSITVNNTNEYVISGLVAVSNYSVQVAGRSINGAGPVSNLLIQTSGEESKYINMVLSS